MSMISAALPGADLVHAGLADIRANRETECSLLVAMAGPRLRRLGIDVPDTGDDLPAHRLYELLSEAGPGAYGRYNALIARMVSFARAAEHASPG